MNQSKINGHVARPLFILYVADQRRAKDFYKYVLKAEPTLDVPGMTEFPLGEGAVLGLMPEKAIVKILGYGTPNPEAGRGIPRCELYLTVDHPKEYFLRAIKAGAKNISSLAPRNWGDEAAYVADPDGHILAFATRHKDDKNRKSNGT